MAASTTAAPAPIAIFFHVFINQCSLIGCSGYPRRFHGAPDPPDPRCTSSDTGYPSQKFPRQTTTRRIPEKPQFEQTLYLAGMGVMCAVLDDGPGRCVRGDVCGPIVVAGILRQG